MNIPHELESGMDQQFEVNKRKNLFYEGLETSNHFLPETKETLLRFQDDLLRIDELGFSNEWIDRMTGKALSVFAHANQYLDLREAHQQKLRFVYRQLWNELVAGLRSEQIDFGKLQKDHLARLSDWLQETNGFTRVLSNVRLPEIAEVVCSEYSALLQLHLFRINPNELQGPLLDIGCGEQANLVMHLRATGTEAYGFDRVLDVSEPFLFKSDWMDFTFKEKHWGTIVSNLSFALHFRHHNQRTDGNYLSYAAKYMEILKSLKPGGMFCYAPDLPFIEQLLPAGMFEIRRISVSDSFSATQIIAKA